MWPLNMKTFQYFGVPCISYLFMSSYNHLHVTRSNTNYNDYYINIQVDELLKQRDSIQSSFTTGRSLVVGSGSNNSQVNGSGNTKVSGDGENNNSPNEEVTSDSKSKKKWFNLNLKGGSSSDKKTNG